MKFLSEARRFANVDDSIARADLNWLLRQEQKDGDIAPTWGGPEDFHRTAILTGYISRVIASTTIHSADPAEDASLEKAAAAAVARALGYLEKQASSYDEPYLIASYVLASLAAGDKFRVTRTWPGWDSSNIAKAISAIGRWSNTPFYGWGTAGRIETTALVLQAFEKASENNSSQDPLTSRGLLFLVHGQDRYEIGTRGKRHEGPGHTSLLDNSNAANRPQQIFECIPPRGRAQGNLVRHARAK